MSFHSSPKCAPDRTLVPVHMHIELSFPLPEKRLIGTVTYKLVAHTHLLKPYLVLNAVDFSSVEVSSNAEIHWHYTGQLIEVVWPTEMSKGSQHVLKVNYEVIEPNAGMYISAPDSNYPRRELYAVTDNESERYCNY